MCLVRRVAGQGGKDVEGDEQKSGSYTDISASVAFPTTSALIFCGPTNVSGLVRTGTHVRRAYRRRAHM